MLSSHLIEKVETLTSVYTDLVIIPICITSWPPKILGFVVKTHSSIIMPAWRMAAIWLSAL
jgi:hypothetical protein